MAFTHFFGKHKKVASCGRRSHFHDHCGWSQWPAIQTGISNGCIHASHYRLPPPTASHCLDLLVTARSTSSRERKVGGYSLWPVVWLNIDRRSSEETGTIRFKYEEILWYSEATVKKRKKCQNNLLALKVMCGMLHEVVCCILCYLRFIFTKNADSCFLHEIHNDTDILSVNHFSRWPYFVAATDHKKLLAWTQPQLFSNLSLVLPLTSLNQFPLSPPSSLCCWG